MVPWSDRDAVRIYNFEYYAALRKAQGQGSRRIYRDRYPNTHGGVLVRGPEGVPDIGDPRRLQRAACSSSPSWPYPVPYEVCSAALERAMRGWDPVKHQVFYWRYVWEPPKTQAEAASLVGLSSPQALQHHEYRLLRDIHGEILALLQDT